MKYAWLLKLSTPYSKMILATVLLAGMVVGSSRPSYATWDIPNTPTLVSVSGSGCGMLTLTWTPPSGPYTGYEISRSLTSGGPYTYIGSTFNTSYTDTGLTNGTRYYYVVQSYYGYLYAVSNDSNEMSGVPACHIAPPWWVTHIMAIPLNETALLDWGAVHVDTSGQPLVGRVSYNVYELESSGPAGSTGTTSTSWVLVASGLHGTQHTITGLTNGVSYAFVVTANTKENGESAYSQPVTVVPSPDQPTLTGAKGPIK